MQGISNSSSVGAPALSTGRYSPDRSTVHLHAECAAAVVACIRSGEGGPAYSASKDGVINIVTASAQRLCGTDVRANAICASLAETGVTLSIHHARDQGVGDKLGRLSPLLRAVQPEELVRFCSSRLTKAVISTTRLSQWAARCLARISHAAAGCAVRPSNAANPDIGDFAWT